MVGTLTVTNETATFIEPYRAAEERSGAETHPPESALSRILFNSLHQFSPNSAPARRRVNSHTPNVERIASRRDRYGSNHHAILRHHPDRAFTQAESNLVGRRDRGRKRFGRIEGLEFQKRSVKRRRDGGGVILGRHSYPHNIHIEVFVRFLRQCNTVPDSGKHNRSFRLSSPSAFITVSEIPPKQVRHFDEKRPLIAAEARLKAS